MNNSSPAVAARRQDRLRRFWLTGLAVLVVAGVAVAAMAMAGSSNAPSQGTTGGRTAAAGAFTAQTAAGEQVPVPGSKPSVLFFFSIECGSCGPSTKVLADIQGSAPERANFVAVDVASYETVPEIEAFLAQYQASSLAYAIDTDARLISAYQVNQLSTAVVLDTSGKVVFRGVEPSAAQIRDALAKAGAR